MKSYSIESLKEQLINLKILLKKVEVDNHMEYLVKGISVRNTIDGACAFGSVRFRIQGIGVV